MRDLKQSSFAHKQPDLFNNISDSLVCKIDGPECTFTVLRCECLLGLDTRRARGLISWQLAMHKSGQIAICNFCTSIIDTGRYGLTDLKPVDDTLLEVSGRNASGLVLVPFSAYSRTFMLPGCCKDVSSRQMPTT